MRFVYGERIDAYLWLLPFVLISTGFLGILSFLNNVFVVIRKMSLSFLFNCLALIVSVVVAMVAIPLWGANGINIAISVSVALDCLVQVAYLVRGNYFR